MESKNNSALEVLKYFVPLVLAVVLFIIIKVFILDANYKLTNISVDKYQKLVSSQKQSLVYITDAEEVCSTCPQITSLLKKVLKGSDIKTYQINLSKLSNEDMGKFMDTFEETKEGVTAPALLLVKDKQILSSFFGPAVEDSFIEFLKTNNLIEK